MSSFSKFANKQNRELFWYLHHLPYQSLSCHDSTPVIANLLQRIDITFSILASLSNCFLNVSNLTFPPTIPRNMNMTFPMSSLMIRFLFNFILLVNYAEYSCH